MDERRVQLLTTLLQPVLSAELPPDVAGSRAIALVMIAVQATSAANAGSFAADMDDPPAHDIHLLPAYIAQAQDSSDSADLVTLVRRFVQGERPQSASAEILPHPPPGGRACASCNVGAWICR